MQGMHPEKIDRYKLVVSIWDRNDLFSNKFLCGVTFYNPFLEKHLLLTIKYN